MRHKIDKNTICITISNSYQGYCATCERTVDVYSYEQKKKNGNSVKRFRCSIAHQQRYKKESIPVDFNMQIETEVAAMASTDEIENKQKGICALCNQYVRKNRHGKRAMFVVRTADGFLPYLFCWDCRTLVNESVHNKYHYRIQQLLSQ
jgi:Zn finger protein HypA/HybF involved in hydrogenase expression